jgi:hypothetical protein
MAGMVVNSDWTSLTRLNLNRQEGRFEGSGCNVHWDDFLDSWLRDVLCQSPQGLEVSLSVDDTHHSVHPIDLARFTRVIPAILRTR